MVQYDEMVRALELREVLLRFLENSLHPVLIKTVGIDMDQFQRWVHKSIPPFNLNNAVITCIVSAIYWQIQLVAIHYTL